MKMLSDRANIVAFAKSRSDWLIAFLVLSWTLLGVVTLPNYGITWDEGLGNMFFGERYFYFFMHPQEKYLDFKADVIPNTPLHLFDSSFRDIPWEFPPLADTVSAASMHLFSYHLGWMDPVDAFHLPKVLMAGLLLWFFYKFTSRHLDKFAALTGLLFMGTFPRLWGDMHFNPKDIPETVLFAMTIFAYVAWQQDRGWVKAASTGLLFGAALAIKANAAFIPLVLILGLWQVRVDWRNWRSYLPGWLRDCKQYALMVLSAGTLYVLSWPYLYVANNPLKGIKDYFNYIISQGGRTGQPGWNWDPIRQVLATTPEWMLIFLAAGLVIAVIQMVRKPDSRIYRLAVVWLLVPILRNSLPGMVNFDGIRHFLEFLPGASLVAAIAAHEIIRFIRGSTKLYRTAAAALIILGILVNTGIIEKTFWGYEYAYFNSFVGGLAGERIRYGDPGATDYWGSTYRQGMMWIRNHAEPGATLYVPVAGYLVKLTAPVWLRSDIQVFDGNSVDELKNVTGPLYVMLLYRPSWWDVYSQRVWKQQTPIYRISLQGQPLLLIYRIQ